MVEIKLSKEQMKTLQKCKTKEEVKKFAKENQLTDEELKKVIGGNSQDPYQIYDWNPIP